MVSQDATSDHQRDLLTRLASASEEVAQDAFVSVHWREFRGNAAIQFTLELVNQLAKSEILPKRAQSNRLRMLLLGLKLVGPELQQLARAAREFPAHLRVTAAEFLPADLRPELYGTRVFSVQPAQPISVPATEEYLAGVADEALTCALSVELGSDPISRAREARDTGAAYLTVFLLSHPDQQVGNIKRFMESATDPSVVLDPVPVQSLQELQQKLYSTIEVCACVIDQSFLEGINVEEQRSLFEDLARYSTFIRLRVQDGVHLHLTHREIEQIIKRIRGLGTDVPYGALSFQSDRDVRPAELAELRRGSDLLRSHVGVQFILGELSPAQAQLLIAAVGARVRAERLDGNTAIERLKITFLRGGRSGASVATVQLNETGRTYVAKITSKDFALEEVPRYRTFVQDWDPSLQPQAFFHANEAVILFGLVPSDDDNSSPAPMLEDRLAELWNQQWMQEAGNDELSRRAEALGSGLERAARSLARLNASEAPPSAFQCYGNPTTTHVESLEDAGFQWGLDSSLSEARRKACARFEQIGKVAVTHGDIQLRNMLVRDDGNVQLIDYESSGPGHPALDLVRFELALYLGPVRQFERESECVEFQRALSIDRSPLEILRANHPKFFQCYVNQTCARGIVAARDAAIEAVRKHGGNPNDYVAAKYVIAWQHVGLIGSHTGLARSVIEALAPEINNWEV